MPPESENSAASLARAARRAAGPSRSYDCRRAAEHRGVKHPAEPTSGSVPRVGKMASRRGPCRRPPHPSSRSRRRRPTARLQSPSPTSCRDGSRRPLSARSNRRWLFRPDLRSHGPSALAARSQPKAGASLTRSTRPTTAPTASAAATRSSRDASGVGWLRAPRVGSLSSPSFKSDAQPCANLRQADIASSQALSPRRSRRRGAYTSECMIQPITGLASHCL